MKPKYGHFIIVMLAMVFVVSAFAQDEMVIEEALLLEELQIFDEGPQLLPEELQSLGTIYLSYSGWSDPAVGTWNSDTLTGTLTQDLMESIQIVNNGITLDGAGYTVAGSGSGNGIDLYGRTGVTIQNLNVQGFFHGFNISNSNTTMLINNTSSNNNSYGFNIKYSIATTLIGNTSSNNLLGIWFWRSHNCTLIDNIFSNNAYYGIYVSRSNNCTLTGNIAELNYRFGIRVFCSDYCILTGNTAESTNGQGISLYYSNYCILTDNIVELNSGYGINLYRSNLNQIYNNSFIENRYQAGVSGSGNVFNLPAPVGGNYWSDWICPDADGDGFVDYPYIFSGGQDNLPLVPEGGYMNEPPVADADPDRTAIVGETVQFNGADSSDPDGIIVSYEWDFGDGTPTKSGVAVSHVYTIPGTYTLTLIVTDNGCAIGTDTAEATIITPAQAIDGLIGIVEAMNLQQGIENSFDVKLEAAQDALVAANAGIREDAVNKLKAFVNAVEAQRGKVVTGEQADQLVNYANRIIAVL
jgi:parallel beta-helix repeat protein